MRLVCSYKECQKPVFNKSNMLCSMHYARLMRHGDPGFVLRRHVQGTPLERYETLVIKTPECYGWDGITDSDGYAILRALGETRASRVAYRLFVGEIPTGLQVDHECHNRDLSCPGGIQCKHRLCTRWDHLRLATPRENVLAARTITGNNSRKTYCKRGHPFDEKNTYIRPGGERQCRACNNARMKASNARKRVMSLSD